MTNSRDELYLIAYKPPHKQNFIAIFYDGSGADLFCWLDSNEIANAEGNIMFSSDELQEWLQDAGYCWWLPLPDDFDFFFMQGLSS